MSEKFTTIRRAASNMNHSVLTLLLLSVCCSLCHSAPSRKPREELLTYDEPTQQAQDGYEGPAMVLPSNPQQPYQQPSEANKQEHVADSHVHHAHDQGLSEGQRTEGSYSTEQVLSKVINRGQASGYAHSQTKPQAPSVQVSYKSMPAGSKSHSTSGKHTPTHHYTVYYIEIDPQEDTHPVSSSAYKPAEKVVHQPVHNVQHYNRPSPPSGHYDQVETDMEQTGGRQTHSKDNDQGPGY